MAVSKHCCKLKVDSNKHEGLNNMFAYYKEEDEIYPLTAIEIAKSTTERSRIKDLLLAECQNTRRDFLFSTY
jgi:hypothetical protein